MDGVVELFDNGEVGQRWIYNENNGPYDSWSKIVWIPEQTTGRGVERVYRVRGKSSMNDMHLN